MTDIEYRRMPGSPPLVYAERGNPGRGDFRGGQESGNQGGSSGSSGGQSGGQSGSGGSSGNQARENPRDAGRGDYRGFAGAEYWPEPYGNPYSGNAAGSRPYPERYESTSNHTQGMTPMNYCPTPAIAVGAAPVAAPLAYSAVAPYALPGYGWGAPYGGVPAAAPASNIVVAGDHGRSHYRDGLSQQIETVSDITLGNLREASATGRANQISTQIASGFDGLGDRLETQAGFAREVTLQRNFFDMAKSNNDTEARIMARIGDQESRFLTELKNAEIRHLQESNETLKIALSRQEDRAQFRELNDDLNDIKRMLRDRA